MTKSWFQSEVPMHIPRCINAHNLYFAWIACCCKPRWYRDYQKALGKVNSDVARQLDIV